MSAQPSPRTRLAPDATTRPGSRGVARDGARARLTVAPDVARRRLRARLLMWGAALVTVASLFTLVAFHVFEAQSAFTMERLSKERANEQLRYARLREQVARLSSAGAVIEAANKIGMVQGPGVVTLSVPTAHAAPGSITVAARSSSESSDSYDELKRALGPNP